MQKMISEFENNKGYARMKELKAAGIHTRIIARALKEEVIEKIAPGLYKLKDYPFDETESYSSVCRANEKAVITLFSAASYYELFTYTPPEVYIAVPHKSSKFSMDWPPVKVFYFIDKYYNAGIEEIETTGGKVKIYSIEKTVIDIFRYRNKLGEAEALECLKTYLRSKNRKVNVLSELAIKLGVYQKMEAYIKGAM